MNVLIPNAKVEKSFQKNLDHAVNVALYFLPEKFTERELYKVWNAGISDVLGYLQLELYG